MAKNVKVFCLGEIVVFSRALFNTLGIALQARACGNGRGDTMFILVPILRGVAFIFIANGTKPISGFLGPTSSVILIPLVDYRQTSASPTCRTCSADLPKRLQKTVALRGTRKPYGDSNGSTGGT